MAGILVCYGKHSVPLHASGADDASSLDKGLPIRGSNKDLLLPRPSLHQPLYQEHKVVCIDTDIKGNEPYFINAGGLNEGTNRRMLMGVIPYAEAWSRKKCE